MDARITNHLPFSLNNENPVFAAKSSTSSMVTPRKIPFKQNGSNTDLLKSALKVEKFQPLLSTPSQPVKAKPTETETVSEFDLDPFVFPADRDCFCCANDRTSDGEFWGRHSALSEELMDSLWTNMKKTERSPRKALSPIPEITPPKWDFDFKVLERLEIDDSKGDSVDYDDSSSDTSMVIPDADLDFSFDLDIPEGLSQSSDDSIIQDW